MRKEKEEEEDEASRGRRDNNNSNKDEVEVSLQREFEKLVTKMWDGKPENRPDFAEIEERLRKGVETYEKEIGACVWTQAALSESSYESREDEDATMTDAENEDGEDAAGKNDQKTAFGNRARFAPCAFDAPLSSYSTMDATTTNNQHRVIRFISDSTFITNTRVHLTPSGSQELDGSNSHYEINKAYEGIQIWSDGTEWFIIQKKA